VQRASGIPCALFLSRDKDFSHSSGALRRENVKSRFVVIASEAKQSIARRNESMDCFVAYSPVRKRFAFVAGNDGSGSLKFE
jgi:hypothetical protein